MVIDPFLSGEKLYGNDFSEGEILQWYADEEEGYANLGASEFSRYKYEYHALNTEFGYRVLPRIHFQNVLGLGSAYGHEFQPIAARISEITILDPSNAFKSTNVGAAQIKYKKPNASGQIDLPTDYFDLAVGFGVLHHIPNVSRVLQEVGRVIKKDGYFLLREPIVSMGDWRYPRVGLTKRERGIPIDLMRAFVLSAGFSIERETLVDFSLTPRIFRALRTDVYNSRLVVNLDALLCKFFSWNVSYHATTNFRKVRPCSAFWVLKKNSAG